MSDNAPERKDAGVGLPMKTEVPAAEIRDQLTDIMNRAGYAGERFVITYRGQPRAVIVGLKDLEILEGAAA